MITKWATSIANKLAELSGEDVSADQLEIYIYGLECFLNTFMDSGCRFFVSEECE